MDEPKYKRETIDGYRNHDQRPTKPKLIGHSTQEPYQSYYCATRGQSWVALVDVIKLYWPFVGPKLDVWNLEVWPNFKKKKRIETKSRKRLADRRIRVSGKSGNQAFLNHKTQVR